MLSTETAAVLPSAVFRLQIPELSVESLEESWIGRWSLEVSTTIDDLDFVRSRDPGISKYEHLKYENGRRNRLVLTPAALHCRHRRRCSLPEAAGKKVSTCLALFLLRNLHVKLCMKPIASSRYERGRMNRRVPPPALHLGIHYRGGAVGRGCSGLG